CATGILGLPGDRAETVIADAARAAARAFDRLILREDRDLRGRVPGEMPRLIQSAIRAESQHIEVQVIPDELDALRSALASMGTGELVVAFCDRTDELASYLVASHAELLSDTSSVRQLLRQHLRIPA